MQLQFCCSIKSIVTITPLDRVLLYSEASYRFRNISIFVLGTPTPQREIYLKIIYLHLFVPTFDDPANQGSRINMHLNKNIEFVM